MNHNYAQQSIANFVKTWAHPSAREDMQRDLQTLLLSLGLREPAPSGECAYCVRGCVAVVVDGAQIHYDLGERVECKKTHTL